MAKRKNKNQSNQNKAGSPPPAKVEPTSEDKERLIREGETRKAELIAEGEKHKQDCIAECELVKEKFLVDSEQDRKTLREKAEKDAEKRKENLLEQWERDAVAGVRDGMRLEIDEARKNAKAIVSEAEGKAGTILSEAKQALQEANRQEEANRARTKELEVRDAKHVTEWAEIQQLRDSYRETLRDEFKEFISSLETTKDELAEAKKRIRILEEDNEALEEEQTKNGNHRRDLYDLKNRYQELSGDHAKLATLFEEQQRELTSTRNSLRIQGDDPAHLYEENKRLLDRIDELESHRHDCPSETELADLRRIKTEYESLKKQRDKLQAEKKDVEYELQSVRLDHDDMENQKRFYKIVQLQKAELERELVRFRSDYDRQIGKAFEQLSKIDDKPHYPSHPTLINMNLKVLCERFRNYLATRPLDPLYYSERNIRTFISAFAATRLIILQGASGTGKSSLPRAFAEFMGSRTESVEVQSSWKDRNDLLGFFNDFEKRYKETEFLKSLYIATKNPEHIHCIMLDEMNISRIEYYFADFLSTLEKDRRDWLVNLIPFHIAKGKLPKLIDEDGNIRIRENTWFVGTANRDDSTFMISDKVYDRAIVLQFDKREEEPSQRIPVAPPIQMNYGQFQTMLDRAVNVSSETLKTIKDIVANLDFHMHNHFEITFGNRISKQIERFVPAYMACGGTLHEALDVIFSTKVLRKLEGLYDDSTQKELQDLAVEMEKQYRGNNVFEESKKKIAHLIRR